MINLNLTFLISLKGMLKKKHNSGDVNKMQLILFPTFIFKQCNIVFCLMWKKTQQVLYLFLCYKQFHKFFIFQTQTLRCSLFFCAEVLWFFFFLLHLVFAETLIEPFVLGYSWEFKKGNGQKEILIFNYRWK
jgi:hypothetical protein